MQHAEPIVNDFLDKIRRKVVSGEAPTPEEKAEIEAISVEREKRRKEYAAQAAENDRINWLNQYYSVTHLHGLPNDADTAALSKLDATGEDADALELLKAWRPSDPFGFLIIGAAGSGKSFALQALAKSIMFDYREFSEKRQKLRWFPVTRGLDQIRREMNENFDGLKQSILTDDFVFFDDLGAENLTDWAREQIYQVLEHRLNFGLPTFISSNCTLEELKARYHERFVSRLKEVCVFIHLKGRDRRGDKMKANVHTLRSRISRAGA
jgi:DNA replication protein DnaC